MGIFDSIGSVLNKVVTTVAKSPIGSALDATTYTFTHPIAATQAIATGTFQQKEQEFFTQPKVKQVTQEVLATAGYVATTLGVGAVAKSISAGTVIADAATLGAKLLPSTTKGKVIAAVAAPVIVGAVAQQPVKSLNTVASAPNKLANVGANLSNVIADPTVENIKTLFFENPVIVGGAAAAIAAPIIYGTASTVSNYLNTSAVKKNTAATIESINQSNEPIYSTGTDSTGIPTITIQNQIPAAVAAASAPAADQTTTFKKVASKKAKKKKKSVKKKKAKKKTTTKKKKKYKKK